MLCLTLSNDRKTTPVLDSTSSLSRTCMPHDYEPVLDVYNAAQRALMHRTWKGICLPIVAAEKNDNIITAVKRKLLCRHGVSTVVTHESHGLSQGPLGCGVGGEPSVVHGKGCCERLILQIFIELAQCC